MLHADYFPIDLQFFLTSYWSAKYRTFVQTPTFSSYLPAEFADGSPTTGEHYQYSATRSKVGTCGKPISVFHNG